MNPVIRLAVLSGGAGILFAGTTALGTAIVHPCLRRMLARIAPSQRSGWLVFLAGVPCIAAAVLLAACFLPSLSALAGLGVDHCPAHADRHAHLCFAHLPAQSPGTIALLLIAAAAGLLTAALLRLCAAQARVWCATRALGRATGSLELSASAPLAVTIGLWRPKVLMTSQLRARLTPDQVAVVLEHERAHARRRDPLRMTLASLLALGHVPWVRGAILADLALACEQACDEDAASRLSGDRLRVAETVVAVEKIASPAPWAPAAFGGANVAARVESLLAPPLLERKPRRSLRTLEIVAGAAAIAALAPAIHHATETLLGFLAP